MKTAVKITLQFACGAAIWYLAIKTGISAIS